MPNNTFPILIVSPVSGQPNYGYISSNPQQQGFSQIQTNIFTFFNSVNYSFTGPFGNTGVIYGTTIPTTNVIDVSDYNSHIFQTSVYNISQSFTQSVSQSVVGNNTIIYTSYFSKSFTNSTSSFSVSSSIDGLNWVGEFSYVNFYPTTASSSFIYSSTTSQSFSGTNTSSYSSSFTNSIYPYYSNSTSSIFRTSSPHRVRYFMGTYSSSYSGSGGINAIGSIYLISGQ